MTKIIVNNYSLDEEQTRPIIENPKYSIIIAGAGSGKSLTLVGKVKYLLENKIYTPAEICCISFTNEATKNLAATILKNCHQEVSTFTFHKLALNILKSEPMNISDPNFLSYIINEFFESFCFGNSFLASCTYKLFSFYFETEENWQKILNDVNLQQLKNTIMTFINLFKCNDHRIEEFLNFFANCSKPELLFIIYAIYLLYETEKESTKSIDFDDMIFLASKRLQEKKVVIPYKMIIIDEFQDTSLSRWHLIEEIIHQNDAALCVVGDDYQSIYHFSGCDLLLFLEFSKIFPNTHVYKLQKTYRNSQELVAIAGAFIQKNPWQIKKQLKSEKHLKNPIKIVYYNNEETVLAKVLKLISSDKFILILGRNNFDLEKYTKKLFFKENNSIIELTKFPHHHLKYLTVHRSKGLESDVVILLNLANEPLGFPSLKQDQDILKYVKKDFSYPYEEERRLFYVAMTRTKEDIYLLVPIVNPSKFVREIKHQKGVEKIYFTS